MMGVRIRQRDGAWWVFVNHKGSRKAKRVGVGDAGNKAAKEAARQIRARLALGQYTFEDPERTLPTVGHYLLSWLREHAAVNCKPSTYAEYQWSIDHILIPDFGPMSLNE